MLEVYNPTFTSKTILKKAFNITEKQVLNEIGLLTFSLTSDDPKNKRCNAFDYVQMDNGEMYQITKTGEDEKEIDSIQYTCRHVLSKMSEKTMDGEHIIGSQTQDTRYVLNYILAFQKDFVLKDCDFKRYFSYGFRNNTVAEALFSVATVFEGQCHWVVNTQVYPFTISLKQLDINKNPDGYARKGVNRLKLMKSTDFESIVTKIKPLGYAEGVSQVNIEKLNNGDPWLYADKQAIDKYGIKEYVWVDQRYTSSETLMAASQAMLAELSNPYIEYDVDLIGDYRIGDIIEIPDQTKNFIVEKTIKYEEIPQITYRIANKSKDVATTITDMLQKSRINDIYSQGSTTMLSNGVAENADASTPCVLRFYLDDDLWAINHFKLQINMDQFRAQGASTTSNGGSALTLKTQTNKTTATVSTKNINVATETQQTQAYTIVQTVETKTQPVLLTTQSQSINVNVDNASSTLAVWNTSETSSKSPVKYADGHTHLISTHYHRLNFAIVIPGMQTQFILPSLSAQVPSQGITITIPPLPLNFAVPGENLSIDIPALTGTTKLDPHSHDVIAKITKLGNPTSFKLYIDNKLIGQYYQKQLLLDATQYLIENGTIKRGRWIEVKVLPNSEAYITCDYNFKGFVQPTGRYSL